MVVTFFSSLDVAEWIGLTGGVIGVLGGAAGVIGAIAAVRGNKIANDAREDAQAANKLSAKANNLAGEANSIAVDANQLSEEANSLVHRSVEIETERHDVRWDPDWVSPGEVLLTNLGDDEAFGVKASIYVDGREYVQRFERVAGGQPISFPVAEGKKLVTEYIKDRASRRRDPLQHLHFDPWGHSLWISHHVVWKSKLGKQHTDSSKPAHFPASDLVGN